MRRLRALEQYTDLGSGFQIAMRDLEIRGAGNILGTRQHGFIAAVGFEIKLPYHHFFTHTGFATDKYIERGVSDSLDLLADLFNVWTYTY